MAPFKEVFSITWKVIAALFLISLGIALVWAFISGMNSSKSAHYKPDFSNAYIEHKDFYDKNANERHSFLPHSEWTKYIATATKVHCSVEGMTKEEALKSMGKPVSAVPTVDASGNSKDTGETWTYEEIDVGDCVKYEGDKCIQQEKTTKTAKLYFSPSGYLTYPFSDNIFRTNCYSGSLSEWESAISSHEQKVR